MKSDLPSIPGSGYPPVDATASLVSKPTPGAASPSSPAPDSKAFVEEAARILQVDNQSLAFNKDEATGKMVLVIVDITTNKVLRQIPSEEMLEIAKSVDRMRGFLVNAKA